MLKNYKNSEWKTDYWYEVEFDDGHGNGYGFPCDKFGNVKDLNPAAMENYEWAMQHPEKFKRFNEVVREESTYREPASGICECGEEVILANDYYGACQCENCGRWYNLFGQELKPPKDWEEDVNEEYEDGGW